MAKSDKGARASRSRSGFSFANRAEDLSTFLQNALDLVLPTTRAFVFLSCFTNVPPARRVSVISCRFNADPAVGGSIEKGNVEPFRRKSMA
jgi:hypothetical protein